MRLHYRDGRNSGGHVSASDTKAMMELFAVTSIELTKANILSLLANSNEQIREILHNVAKDME